MSLHHLISAVETRSLHILYKKTHELFHSVWCEIRTNSSYFSLIRITICFPICNFYYFLESKKLKYTRIAMPLNNLEQFVMSLEAFDCTLWYSLIVWSLSDPAQEWCGCVVKGGCEDNIIINNIIIIVVYLIKWKKQVMTGWVWSRGKRAGA